MITSLIISLILTYLLCLLIDIRNRDIIIIATISTLVIIILNKCLNMNNKVSGFIYNNNLFNIFSPKNFSLNQFHRQQNNFENQKIRKNSTEMGKLYPEKYGEIIPPNMYNQEDCTTNGLCIQKADENNLFPGFYGNKNISSKINNLNFKIAKMENNIKNMNNDEGIFIEQFQNNRSPQELVDIIKPFNKTIITPYESNPKPKNNIKSQEMMETNGICFHSKMGTCNGGICKTKNKNEIEGINTHSTEQSNIALTAHPYTDVQPLIRITNPGQHDFE